MGTYTQIIYQIVFTTKNRENTLSKDNRQRLFEYIVGIILNNKCHVYCVNGVDNHIHILLHLHPTVALAWLVKDIKLASTALIKEKRLFKNFAGWQEGYSAFTYSIKEKGKLIAYIQNQEQHHKSVSCRDESVQLLNDNEIAFDDKYV